MEPIDATLDRRQLIDHLSAGQVIFGVGAAATQYGLVADLVGAPASAAASLAAAAPDVFDS